MAHGDNHAKKIVIEQAIGLADKLQNGNAGCAETQGKAIGLLVKMITPLYEAEFVTTQECINRLNRFKRQKKSTRIKIGPVEVEGPLTTAMILHVLPVICYGLLIFMVGKSQSWW